MKRDSISTMHFKATLASLTDIQKSPKVSNFGILTFAVRPPVNVKGFVSHILETATS